MAAQPEDPGGDIGRDRLAIADDDRHLGIRRGEDLRDDLLEADRAAVERRARPARRRAAGRAPGRRRNRGDGGASRPGWEDRSRAHRRYRHPPARGRRACRPGPHRRAGSRAAAPDRPPDRVGAGPVPVGVPGGRDFPVIGAGTGKFCFFPRRSGRFLAFFPFDISAFRPISLFCGNREIARAEQGIGTPRTGNSRRPGAGDTGQGRERVKHCHGGTLARAWPGLNQAAGRIICW